MVDCTMVFETKKQFMAWMEIWIIYINSKDTLFMEDGASGHATTSSVVSRARHWVLDAQIMILDARNSSECVNLDAQVVVLDTQSKHWHPISGFRKFISNLKWNTSECIQTDFENVFKCKSDARTAGDTFSTSLIGAFPSVPGLAGSATAQLLLCITAKKIS